MAEDEEQAAVACNRITAELSKAGLIGGAVDGRAAARAADGELKLLATEMKVEKFEVEKVDPAWDLLKGPTLTHAIGIALALALARDLALALSVRLA